VALLPGAQPFRRTGGPVGVLLCHGFTATPMTMRPWAEFLAEAGLSVSVPLLPGHGTRWQDMASTGWPDWYAEVERALLELDERCEQVFVGGLSMGGALALRLAQCQPAKVAGLLLVNPAVLLTDWRLALLPVLSRLRASAPAIAGDIARPGVTELAYERTPLRPLRSMLRLQATVRAELSTVTAPIALWRSRADHVVPAASSALVRQSVRSADVTETVCENSFHVVTLDHDAKRLFHESLAFIRRLVPASAEG
jgi:carboxylesterase